MRTLYIECNMGAAGDMLLAALLELIPDKAEFLQTINQMGIPGVTISSQPSEKCGIVGAHITVTVNGEEEESLDVHTHSHDGGHTHGHDAGHTHAHEHDAGHTHDYADGHTHTHDHETGHAHEHNIASAHTHNHVHADASGHTHAHEHTDGHSHDHTDGHTHTHEHNIASAHTHDHVHAEASGHTHTHEHTDSHTHDAGHTHDHGDGHAHTHDHDDNSGHFHADFPHIAHFISHLNLPEDVAYNATGVYELLASAESKAHGLPVDLVHFHEVGALDAVADIVSVCYAMWWLQIERVLVSPIHVGSGQVRTSHGILPVPAPATAHILQGVPSYSGSIQGELCTPTGAALLVFFADAYGAMPVMAVEGIGYGMGKKDFEAANCVRVFMGEQNMSAAVNNTIAELKCNLDDMTPEEIGFASELLLDRGALDVFTTPIYMKKNRPAVLLTVLCKMEQADEFAMLMLGNTTTIGVRKTICDRYILQSGYRKVETRYGDITMKTSTGYGMEKYKAEFGDIMAAAKTHDVPLSAIYDELGKQKPQS